MKTTLHITSGDIAGSRLEGAGLPGEVFVWHDILYDGPRGPGRPDEEILRLRARFIEEATGGGLGREFVLETFRRQYRKLSAAADYERIVLWFDACLFDQAMLAHVLACLPQAARRKTALLCVDAFPGIQPFHGLGQLTPVQLASCCDLRRPVTAAQFDFARVVDWAFAAQDLAPFEELAAMTEAPLPWVPAAVARWLEERPDAETGLGRLEAMALEAVRGGCETPAQIFAAASAADTPPQYWGDTTLWAKVNALADRRPPLVHIEGPLPHLPQWEGIADLGRFRVTAVSPRSVSKQHMPEKT